MRGWGGCAGAGGTADGAVAAAGFGFGVGVFPGVVAVEEDMMGCKEQKFLGWETLFQRAERK